MTPRRLGTVLKQLRGKMSQTDLAKKARVGRTYIVKLERGAKENPSLAILQRLAKALKVKVGRLLE